MAYKKLNRDELQSLWKNLKSLFEDAETYSNVIALVKRYFKNAHSIFISVDSEYNDQNYDNRLNAIYVYDENGVECGLTRDEREKFTIETSNLDLGVTETDGPMEDIILYVNDTLPEVYVKENKNG